MNSLAHIAAAIHDATIRYLLPVVCAILFSGCATGNRCKLNVSPEGYTARVHDWMAQASARYEGRAWEFDTYDVTIVEGKYQIKDGKGGMIWVNGNSVGTHASGKYKSKVNIQGNADKYGVWECLNVLSCIHDGQMLDGKQPKQGKIKWPQ